MDSADKGERYIPSCDCWEYRTIINDHGVLGQESWKVWVHVKHDDNEYDNLYSWWHDGNPSLTWKFCPHCGAIAKIIREAQEEEK